MNQFKAFIDDLRATHGKNLAAVILYGSAAAGDFIPHRSDYNLLIALNEITPKDLSGAQACLREWSRLGHPVPVYFTVNELQTAADVFPIEFHNMERARKVLYGADVLANLQISDEFLRHQTEYELRSKLIQLRRQYIPASVSTESLINLMAESLSSFAALFRAVLMLRDIEPPVTKQEIIRRTAQSLQIDEIPFAKILNIREKNAARALDEISANQLFTEYMREIEKVVAAVDQLKTS